MKVLELMDKLTSVELLHLQDGVKASRESELVRVPVEQRVYMRRVSKIKLYTILFTNGNHTLNFRADQIHLKFDLVP